MNFIDIQAVDYYYQQAALMTPDEQAAFVRMVWKSDNDPATWVKYPALSINSTKKAACLSSSTKGSYPHCQFTLTGSLHPCHSLFPVSFRAKLEGSRVLNQQDSILPYLFRNTD